MTTIRMVDPAAVSGKVREIFEAVLRRERTVFGANSVSNIWRCMEHSAALVSSLTSPPRRRPRHIPRASARSPR